ncbi:MAG: damage-inducible protein CinA [Candidatus Marinimicrobia bacterium]|nr:damage-inducible protein CinA [Legionellales bacterium]MAX10210.1 damage-inducible protein CinA [Candidatus Neomarinimicrobiota bacterium]|tara:strand:- start:6084 stop:6560 length:477 start_codon:yes stop_codon:yes gene_type:complete
MDIENIAKTLIDSNQTVSVAEACTCGLLGSKLGSVSGSSKYFPGGVVAYTGGLKESILGVPKNIAEEYGTVSEEMAIAMAEGILNLANTDYAISTTGVTGPNAGRSGHPIGTFWIGFASKQGKRIAKQVQINSDRNGNKDGASDAALSLLSENIIADI